MQIDRRAAGAFARTLLEHLSSSMTVTMLELGRRLGLLEALADRPMTPEELAAHADVELRYVTEWAELLVTAGVLHHLPGSGAMVLPPEHAAALVDPSPYNLSGMVTMATATARSLDDLQRVFTHGGGLSYDDQPVDVDEVMHRMSSDRYDALLVGSYLAQVPGLVDRLAAGAAVLELGCGQGHASRLIAEAFPLSTVVGVDISASAVRAAIQRAAERGVENVSFVEGSATAPPEGPWDVVCFFDVVHDLAQPFEALAAARRVLADEGVLLMIDSGAPPTLAERAELPWAPLMYGVSIGHCMTVSLAQDGVGLGTMWGRDRALDALADAGFVDVETFELKGDPMDLLYVARVS